MYNSLKDALLHKSRVNGIGIRVLAILNKRLKIHDNSKLVDPEKSTYDRYIPLLKKVKYGTPEYMKLKDKMYASGGNHHTKVNRHHPEYFENGIKGMNIIDFTEMCIDWYAASTNSDTSFLDGLDANKKRYNLSDDIICIIRNSEPILRKCYEEYKNTTDESEWIH